VCRHVTSKQYFRSKIFAPRSWWPCSATASGSPAARAGDTGAHPPPPLDFFRAIAAGGCLVVSTVALCGAKLNSLAPLGPVVLPSLKVLCSASRLLPYAGPMSREHARGLISRPAAAGTEERERQRSQEPAPVPVGVTSHRTQQPRGQVAPPPTTPSPLQLPPWTQGANGGQIRGFRLF
jgi:hypothetical protein